MRVSASSGMSSSLLSAQVMQLLEDPERLRSTGSRAATRARGWTEEANAAELIRLIHSVT